MGVIARQYITISDCAVILEGKNVDKKKLNTEKKGLPYIVGASSLQNGQLKCKSYCENTENQIISQKGDVIISTVGTLGKMAVNNIGDCVLSKHVCAVRFVPSILPEYGLLCLMGSIGACIPPEDETATGFSRKLNPQAIGELPLLLLTIDEQQITVDKMVFLTANLQIKLSEQKKSDNLPDNPVELAEWYKKESSRILREQHKALNSVVKLLKGCAAGDSEYSPIQLDFDNIFD